MGEKTASQAVVMHTVEKSALQAPVEPQNWEIEVFECGYCLTRRSSRSKGRDGRVRIRCRCGAKYADNQLRMHANWRLVTDASKPQEAVQQEQLPSAEVLTPVMPIPPPSALPPISLSI